MKCPKCKSTNTRKVWVHEPNWRIGAVGAGQQICKDCNHQDDWLLFCDPPIIIKYVPPIIDPGDSNE